MIIGGDFNVVKDPDLDGSGGVPKQKESTKFLNSICLNYDLVDIWRIRNPGCKLFTWKQNKPLIQRRLDFWLISDVCQDEVEEANIKVTVDLQGSNFAKIFFFAYSKVEKGINNLVKKSIQNL